MPFVWPLTETREFQAGGTTLPETPEMVLGHLGPGLSWVQQAPDFPTAAYSQPLVTLVDTHLSSLSGVGTGTGALVALCGAGDKASSPGYFLALFTFTPSLIQVLELPYLGVSGKCLAFMTIGTPHWEAAP